MLKKIILLIFIAIPAACKPIDFHIMGGVNFSTYRYDNNFGKSEVFTQQPESYWGQSWQIGIGTELEVNTWLSIFSELNYQIRKMGTRNIYIFDSESYYPLGSEDKLKYVALPIGMRATIKNFPYFLCGVENLFLHKVSREICQFDCNNFDDISEIYENFSFAVLVGTGYKFRFGNRNVLIELRYSKGLTDKFIQKYEFFKSNAVDDSIQLFVKFKILNLDI